MAAVSKQDSNGTGLRYCVEQSIGVLPGSPIWIPLEPNEYKDFGGQLSLVARNPINSSRQRKKGVITDLDASGSFMSDVTQRNMQDLLQGFMFATTATKNTAVAITAVNGSGLYSMANTTGFVVGSLVFCAGFTNAANNGLKVVSAISAGVSITLSGTSVIETPAATATTTIVGHRVQTAADVKVSAVGGYPTLTSTSLNFTTLGLSAGEFIFIGGDNTANQFATAANNGFKRIKSIAANVITLDKSSQTMVTDTATGKTVDLYFGKVLKNQTGSNIVRRTYQLERTLGAPDDAQPTQIQSEYLVGAVPSEFMLNVATADKVTADLSFVAINNEQRTGATGVKSGTRPALVESDAFNTSSDFSRMRIAVLSSTSEAPTPLIAYVTELSIGINNNVTPSKAVSVLGAFDVTAGTFTVTGNMTAYFADVAAIAAVRNNSNVTLDIALVKNNAGIVIDVPLMALGDGRADIKQDEPITIPLSMEAATGAAWDANMDYTLSFTFYDYLPSLADV
jgi:Phage tail tube protein